MSTKLFPSIVTFCLGMTAALACADPGPRPQTIDVTLTTYGTRLSPQSPHAGDVKFVVKNNAADMTHEFFLVKTDLPQDRLPMDDDGKVEEDSPQIEKVIAAEDIKPGNKSELSANLTPGHYVYFCNINAHHMIGMRGEFTITPKLADNNAEKR